jgi:hypothetical protein
MRVPQVNERVKEAPASALRAMFAGIGSLLFVRDKIKSKPAPETPAATEAAAPEATAPETTTGPETTAAAETAAAPEAVAEPETSAAPDTSAAPETTVVEETTVASEEAAPATVVAETTVAPETAVAETTAAPASAAAAALPLPNYDELSLASLRARLRNLTADQLTILISYEKSHEDRADVITMFERRITKLALGLTQSLPKVTE